jgi:hypothetical protein
MISFSWGKRQCHQPKSITALCEEGTCEMLGGLTRCLSKQPAGWRVLRRDQHPGAASGFPCATITA